MWSLPISTDIMFSHFLVHFSFSVKDKKKSAEGAEDAEAPQAPAGRGGVDFYGPIINVAKFRKVWDFFAIYIL